MVQVLPPLPSFGGGFGQGFGEGLASGLSKAVDQYQQQKADAQRTEALNKLFPELTAGGVGQQPDESGEKFQAGKQEDFNKRLIAATQTNVGGKPLLDQGTASLIQKAAQQQQNFQQQQMEASPEYQSNLATAKKMGEANADYISQLQSRGHASRESLNRISQMEGLNEKDLANPLQSWVSEHFGIPLSLLADPNSEQYQKLASEQFKDIQSYFGSRILQIDVENYLKTIPTLMNSQEGRKRILTNQKILAKADQRRYQIYKDIVKKNKGNIPRDIQEMMHDAVENDSTMVQLGKDFENNLPDTLMIDKKGNYRQVEHKDMATAARLGYERA